jgi:hypothetical protein
MTTSRQFLRGSLAALSFVSASVQAAPAAAQGQNEAAARALFNDGRQLVKEGRYDEACPKFQAARKLYTSAGLLLNLADCDERANRTASAWAEFADAASAAASAGRQNDEIEAKRRQADLEGRLSRLTIRVTGAARDQVVKRDGAAIDRAAWDSAIPVDPGVHAIVAEAPNRTPWSASVSVTEPGKTVTIEVPELNAIAADKSGSSTPVPTVVGTPLGATSPGEPYGRDQPEGASGGRSHALEWSLIGGGIAVGAAGAVVMAVEVPNATDANRRHDRAAYNEATSGWTIGLVGSVVGAAAVVAGGIVLAASSATPSNAAASRASVRLEIGVASACLRGSW